MTEHSHNYQSLRLSQCRESGEWEAAKSLRRRYFFDKVPMADPYEWTFTHSDHVHFVLYLGPEIIGYAHVQLWPESRAAVRIIVVEEVKRRHGFGARFMQWIEEWLAAKEYKSVHAESSPNAVEFYRRLSYTEMPFDDPDGYEGDGRDTPMGKLLST